MRDKELLKKADSLRRNIESLDTVIRSLKTELVNINDEIEVKHRAMISSLATEPVAAYEELELIDEPLEDYGVVETRQEWEREMSSMEERGTNVVNNSGVLYFSNSLNSFSGKYVVKPSFTFNGIVYECETRAFSDTESLVEGIKNLDFLYSIRAKSLITSQDFIPSDRYIVRGVFRG